MKSMFVIRAFSARSISDGKWLIPLIFHLRNVFNLESFSGDKVVSYKENKDTYVSDILFSLKNENMFSTEGRIGFSFFDEGKNTLISVDLVNKIRENNNYYGHKFEIELPLSRWKNISKTDKVKLLEIFANNIQANLLVGDGYDGFLLDFNSHEDLRSGIPGVYELMLFGPAFVSMIGAEKLSKLPVEIMGYINKKWFWFCLSNEKDFRSERESCKKQNIRKIIGDDYFSKPLVGDVFSMPMNGGVFSLLKMIFKTKMLTSSSKYKASKCPKIDYSELL